MKVNYKIWMIVFLIVISVSYLFIINNKINYLYDHRIDSDVALLDFNPNKFIIFIIINIIFSYLISYVISNIRNKEIKDDRKKN